ncbi:MAG: MFS transporter [Patescibacteria group bacterium]
MHYTKPHIDEYLQYYFHNKELDEIYISSALKEFAQSIAGIFVPIYFLTIGLSLPQIAIYYLIHYVIVAVLYPIGTILNSKIGMKKMMALGIFSSIGFFVVLEYMPEFWSYLVSASLWGMSTAFYFSARQIEFSKVVDRGREGAEFSVFRIITIFSGAVGPILGAFIITGFSFSVLLWVVSGLLLLAPLPLFWTPDIKSAPPKLSIKDIKKAGKPLDVFAYQVESIVSFSLAILWPIFIYQTLGEVLSLGIIVSLTSAMIIVLNIYLGRLSDIRPKALLRFGAISHSLTWVSRMFFLTPVGVFVSNLLSSATYSATIIPFVSMVFVGAEKAKNVANYFIFRELSLFSGRLIILAILFFVPDLRVVFYGVAVVSLFFVLFTRSRGGKTI